MRSASPTSERRASATWAASSFGRFSTFCWASMTLRLAVRCGNRLKFWKTMPTWARILVYVDLLGGDFRVFEVDAAAGGLFEQVYAAQHGGLARPGRSKHHNHLATLDFEVDVAEHDVVVEGLLKVLDADRRLRRERPPRQCSRWCSRCRSCSLPARRSYVSVAALAIACASPALAAASSCAAVGMDMPDASGALPFFLRFFLTTPSSLRSRLPTSLASGSVMTR